VTSFSGTGTTLRKENTLLGINTQTIYNCSVRGLFGGMPRRTVIVSPLNLAPKNAHDEPGPFYTDIITAPK
jgi:hypothetical protein